jgi:hypothetical protein
MPKNRGMLNPTLLLDDTVKIESIEKSLRCCEYLFDGAKFKVKAIWRIGYILAL